MENKLQVAEIKKESYAKVIEIATKMASNCYGAYMKAKPQTKRKLNQAFFEKVYARDNEISKTDFSELFDIFFNHGSNKNVLAPGVGLEPTTH